MLTTTPNPKCLALQQGYNGLTKKSYVQVSEPILLDTWQHNYAIGPSQMSLFLTFGPQYLKDLFYDPSGAYAVGRDRSRLAVDALRR